MKSIEQLHLENRELVSKSNFAKDEILFLRKLVLSEFPHSLDHPKYDLLNGYMSILDNSFQTLQVLDIMIGDNEREVAQSYQSIYKDLGYISLAEERNKREVLIVSEGVSAIRESIMEFLLNSR